MIISCTSCNAKYLVNSAELKPNGRTVQCSKCSYKWFQDSSFSDEEPFLSSSSILPDDRKVKNQVKSDEIHNLPSTYVKERKPSFINSILVILFITFFITSFWYYKNSGINFYVFIYYYFQEFYFNLKLIIHDLAKIIHYMIN